MLPGVKVLVVELGGSCGTFRTWSTALESSILLVVCSNLVFVLSEIKLCDVGAIEDVFGCE